MSIPILYRDSVGFVARCGQCLTFSGTELASSPDKAWRALKKLGWSEGSDWPVCPKCTKGLPPDAPAS
jgi:hypothetical protein